MRRRPHPLRSWRERRLRRRLVSAAGKGGKRRPDDPPAGGPPSGDREPRHPLDPTPSLTASAEPPVD